MTIPNLGCLSRPLRIEYAGALHHVMARGNGRGDVFVDDDDHAAFLSEFARTCERFDWLVWSYCLMGNHYHRDREGVRSWGRGQVLY